MAVGVLDQALLQPDHLASRVDVFAGGEPTRAGGTQLAHRDDVLAGQETIREPLDPLDGGSLAVGCGDLLDDVAAGERAAFGGEHGLDPGEQPRLAQPLAERPAPPKRGLDVEPAGSGALAPLSALLGGPHPVVLRPPALQRRDLARASGGPAPLGHPRLDLSPAAREGAQGLVGDTRDLGGAAVDLTEGDAELAVKLGSQVGLVEVARRLRAAISALAVERAPLTVRRSDQVRDEDVGVKLGVAGAAHVVAEGRS